MLEAEREADTYWTIDLLFSTVLIVLPGYRGSDYTECVLLGLTPNLCVLLAKRFPERVGELSQVRNVLS